MIYHFDICGIIEYTINDQGVLDIYINKKLEFHFSDFIFWYFMTYSPLLIVRG